ncbi:phospholipid scramblase-related protein [uncultured Jatrophihabitans sp.]|uniref:phospholipid scramblase-related protein n=1 Tax=uncultured Jatrophihabitans sp. TaxID=1610747 RepID=UPI0035CC0109
MTQSSTPAGWYADPAGRHEKRYFDGQQWTEHVNSHGRAGIDPPGAPSHVPTVQRAPERVQRDVQRAGTAGAAAYQGGGTLFTEPVLVVNQKAKLIEISNEYAIYDQHARQIGAVREVGQSGLKKAARFVSSLDQYMTHKLQITDMSGQPVLALTRPAKFVKSRILVEAPNGQPVGEIVQQNAFGKIRFGLESGGHSYGLIQGENWRAWNFSIKDHTGTEVARITKTWEGLAKTMFTTADNYVVQIHKPLEEPLRSLVLAAAVSVDTALKQDSRGFG